MRAAVPATGTVEEVKREKPTGELLSLTADSSHQPPHTASVAFPPWWIVHSNHVPNPPCLKVLLSDTPSHQRVANLMGKPGSCLSK